MRETPEQTVRIHQLQLCRRGIPAPHFPLNMLVEWDNSILLGRNRVNSVIHLDHQQVSNFVSKGDILQTGRDTALLRISHQIQ